MILDRYIYIIKISWNVCVWYDARISSIMWSMLRGWEMGFSSIHDGTLTGKAFNESTGWATLDETEEDRL